MMQPASATIYRPDASILRTLFIRSSDSITTWSSARAMVPLARPELPPNGITDVRVSAQIFITPATSSVLAGRTTMAGSDTALPSQSL